MARNIRQKYPPPPARATKRRDYDSSSLDLSDDTGYSGVEDVSDSDDEDEEHVVAAEEEHIISNASRKRSSGPPRPLMQDDDEDAEDEDSEAEDGEEEGEFEDGDAADDSTSWNGISSDHDDDVLGERSSDVADQTPTVERHVRFAGIPDSDSDSTTSETSDSINDFFPDIFVDQSTLDPSFRREIEDDDDASSNSSFWDFHSSSQDILVPDPGEVFEDRDATPIATPRVSELPSELSTPVPAEVQDLDGYETDGDTTEEDEPEPIVRKKQMRRVQAELSSDSDTERPVRYGRGKPRVGRFNLDRSDNKPIGVVDPASGKMIIFTPRRMNQLDLSPESLQVDFSAPDLSSCTPLVRNPGFIMMGAMVSSNTYGDFMNMQPFGPAEAFFPCTSDALTGDESDDSFFAGVEEDEEENKLRLEDFLTIDNDSSDDEGSGPDWNGDASSPTRPKTAASTASGMTDSPAVHPLLSHFDNNSDLVGAFRRNQINQQLISSAKATQESLAFSGPYYHGTLRGIKSGSMGTVTTAITPERRRRNSMVGMNGFSDFQQSSPLNIISQKRKASGNHADNNMHKRHRSISDMEVLQI